jgi:histidine triad (HIT) family protein
MATNCKFCEIAQSRAFSLPVYDDSDCMAVLDINPITEGHTILIPKKHYVGLWDLPYGMLPSMMSGAQKIIQYYKRITGNPVYMMVMGEDQDHHVKIHILPNCNRRFATALRNCIKTQQNSIGSLNPAAGERSWNRYKHPSLSNKYVSRYISF